MTYGSYACMTGNIRENDRSPVPKVPKAKRKGEPKRKRRGKEMEKGDDW